VLQVQADPREVSLSEHVTLKMVTFNIQDTYIVGTNRQERMEAIAGKLCELCAASDQFGSFDLNK